jgi:hypothetical protein
MKSLDIRGYELTDLEGTIVCFSIILLQFLLSILPVEFLLSILILSTKTPNKKLPEKTRENFLPFSETKITAARPICSSQNYGWYAPIDVPKMGRKG